MTSPIEALIDAHVTCNTCGKSGKVCKCVHVRECSFRDCGEDAVYSGVVGNMNVVCCEEHSKESDIDGLCLL